MRIGLFIAGILAAGTLALATSAAEMFTLPAEFDSQGAVWIGARPLESGHPAFPVVMHMVRALTPHVDVYLMVPDAATKTEIQGLLRSAGVDVRRVHYWTSTSSPTRWYRDVGAIFLKGNEGHLK